MLQAHTLMYCAMLLSLTPNPVVRMVAHTLQAYTLIYYAVLLCTSVAFIVSAYIHTSLIKRLIKIATSLLAFLGMVLVGVYFALSVGMADFCSGPNAAVSGIISPGDNSENTCVDPTDTACVAAYFVNCPEGSSSPFTPQAVAAETALEEGVVFLDALVDACACDLSVVRAELGGIQLSVQCSYLETILHSRGESAGGVHTFAPLEALPCVWPMPCLSGVHCLLPFPL
jgi:hypothetical protein